VEDDEGTVVNDYDEAGEVIGNVGDEGADVLVE
jgi:hypothetical protein